MKRRLLLLLVGVLLVVGMAVPTTAATAPKTLWDAYKDVPTEINIGGRTQYLVAYDGGNDEPVYVPASEIGGVLAGRVAFDAPGVKLLTDYAAMPATLRKLSAESIGAADLCDDTDSYPINLERSLTKGKRATTNWYYYSLTVWWTYDYCQGAIDDGHSSSANTDTLCYSSTATETDGRIGTNTVWSRGDYTFTLLCPLPVRTTSRWIRGQMEGMSITWNWANP